MPILPTAAICAVPAKAAPQGNRRGRYGRAVSSSKPRWDRLGVVPDGQGGANIALWAQGAEAVDLCILEWQGDQWHEVRHRLRERVHHIFHDHLPHMPVGTRYGFRVHGPWQPERGWRWNPHKLLVDPYARAITGRLELNSAIYGHVGSNDLEMDTSDSAPYVPHSIVCDSTFDWGDDRRPQTPWTDTVIYEAHVRGTTLLHPDIPEHERGTYRGLAHPSVIAHLASIGVTAVELLPIHHFVDEIHLLERGLTNYWGYNSIGFFAPHERYASVPGNQVDEFKYMVRALHAAGLEVILDVVYNHTAEGNQLGPTLSFRGIDNDDYYRVTDDGRYYVDFTGCGNTLDLSQPNVLQMVMDSLRYWVTEMHVDGFRFDLASALARSFSDVDMMGTFLSTIAQDPVLRTVKLIAEPWDVGPGGYQVGSFPVLWAEWNDKYRDTLRSFWRGTHNLEDLGWRLSGSADLYASDGKRPHDSINFITAHDGFTLHDLVSYDHKHNAANLEDNRDGTDNNISANYGHEGPTDDPVINAIRRRQMRNFLATLLLSNGVPMINAGDEIARTQHGNNNAYCQDNTISWTNWDLEAWQRDLLAFTQRAAALRRDHRTFRQHSFFGGRPLFDGGPKDLAWFGPDGHELSHDQWSEPGRQTVMMFMSGQAHSTDAYRPWTDTSFLIVFHAGSQPIHVTLPGAPYAHNYSVVLDTSTDDGQPSIETITAGDTVPLDAYHLMVCAVTQ